MGLSNQERYKKIVWAIHHIEEELRHLQNDYQTERLKKYEGKLFPALLNQTGNPAFWIYGGSFDSDSFDGCDLISTAFEAHMEDLRFEKQKRKGQDYVFEHKPDVLENAIQIENLISHSVVNGRGVVNIWKWVESFLYAANRYSDEMAESLTPIKNVISNLQGDLFAIISKNNKYLSAYLMSRILNKCVNIYDDEDILVKTIRSMYLHHNFNVDESTNAEVLMDMWVDIQFKSNSDIETNTKILYTLRCMGRRPVDNKEKIFDALKDYVDHDSFEEVFKQLAKNKEEYDEKNKYVPRDHCDLTWRWKY